MTSLDDAGRQTDAEGSPQEAFSGGSIYYNGPTLHRTIPVSFGSPVLSCPHRDLILALSSPVAGH